jgi:hypothetical protein
MMCLEALELEVPASVPAVPTRSAAVARISRVWASVARRAARRRGCRQEEGAKTRHKQLGSEKAQARRLISPSPARATPTVPFVGSRRNLRIAARRLPVADCSPLSTPSSTRFFEGLLP